MPRRNKKEEKSMSRKTIWQRAYEEHQMVEEKATGFRADVVMADGGLYLDEGGDFLTPVSEFTEDDFWIVNE
jgi:hypothetical protein